MTFPLALVDLVTPDVGLSTMFGKTNAATSVLNNPLLPFLSLSNGQTLALADAGKIQFVDSSDPEVILIPTNASVAFAVGETVIPVIGLGTGTVSITADTGVTLNGVSAGSGDLVGQYSGVTLFKVATDTWVVLGGIGAIS